MLELFYGDSYLVAEELAKIARDYSRKVVIDEAAEINQVKVLSRDSLFGEKVLLVFRSLLAVFSREPDLWEELLVQSRNGQRVILWEEEKLDQRLRVVKEIQGQGGIRCFKPLTPWQLRRWILAKAEIEQAAVEELASRISSNLWLLENELAKLSLFRSDGIIDQNAVQKLGSFENQESVFAWVDAVGGKDWAAAASRLATLLSQEDHFKLFNLLVRQFRLLILLKSGQALAEVPFVAEKIKNQARFWTLLELKNSYQKLCELEFAVKSGSRELADELLLFQGESAA